MSFNLPFVDEVRTAPRTILFRLLIKDLTRPCFHLLRGVVELSLNTTASPIANLSELRLFCHTSSFTKSNCVFVVKSFPKVTQ